MPVVTEVFGHFSFEGFLNQQLGQLLEQAILADQVFGFLVVAQQLRNEFIGDAVFLGRDVDSGRYGSFLPNFRLRKILHSPPLSYPIFFIEQPF